MSETMKKKEGAVIRTMPFHAPILLCGIFITVILSGIYLYRTNNCKFAIFSICCFALAIVCFACFVMGDKPNFKNSLLAFEGLWQRLSLLFMYLPLTCFVLFGK